MVPLNMTYLHCLYIICLNISSIYNFKSPTHNRINDLKCVGLSLKIVNVEMAHYYFQATILILKIKKNLQQRFSFTHNQIVI